MDGDRPDRASLRRDLFVGSVYDHEKARQVRDSQRLCCDVAGASLLEGHNIAPDHAAELAVLLDPPPTLHAFCRRSQLFLSDGDPREILSLEPVDRSTPALVRGALAILRRNPLLRFGLALVEPRSVEDSGRVFFLLLDARRRILVREPLTSLYADALVYPEWPRVLAGIRGALERAAEAQTTSSGAFGVWDLG